jgi:predicted nucleic acid-binding protein
MQDIAVFNSSPLINLAKAGQLDLLGKLFEVCYIPEEVYNELIIEGKDKFGCIDIQKHINENTIKVKKIKDSIFGYFGDTDPHFGDIDPLRF